MSKNKNTKKRHKQSWTVPNIPPAIRPVHTTPKPQDNPKPDSSKPNTKSDSSKPEADKPKK